MDSTIPLSEFIPPPTEINDTHKVYSIAIAYILLALLTCLVVVARLAYRFQKNNLGIDDYVIIPSLVSLKKLPISNIFFLVLRLCVDTLYWLDRPRRTYHPDSRDRQAAPRDHSRGIHYLVQGPGRGRVALPDHVCGHPGIYNHILQAHLHPGPQELPVVYIMGAPSAPRSLRRRLLDTARLHM